MFRSSRARRALSGAALLAALAVAPAGPAEGAAANRFLNPGFELSLPDHPWMPAAWDTSVSGLLSVFFGRDTFVVHGGRYAVSVANLSTLVPMAHNWSQSFIVDRNWWGKDVVYSIWTKSNGLQGRAFMRAAIYRDTMSKMARTWGVSRDHAGNVLGLKPIDDPQLELGWKSLYFIDPETDWVRREVRLHIPPSSNWLRLSFGISGTGQVIFDDASLTLERAAPPPALPLRTNLIKDPGFEGDGTDWEYSMPPYEGTRVERDTTLSHSGKTCMHFEDAGNGFNVVPTGACQPILNRNLGGKHVRLTGWLKTDSLGGTANVAMFFRTPQGSESPVPQLHSGTMDWTEISLEADTPPDTYEAWLWFMYQSPARGRIYFDDVSFEVLGPAKKPEAPAPAPKKSSASKKSAPEKTGTADR